MCAKVAIIYDFDGTLSPQPMQEYTVLRQLQIAPAVFWEEVRQIAYQEQAEPMLTYMRLIVEYAEKKEIHLSRKNFNDMAAEIEYYPGVKAWFARINNYITNECNADIEINHYIISAGMQEILEGIDIAKNFKKIYASEYHYDFHGRPTFPKQLITDTTKTQCLFRINKGREELFESINEHMPIEDRPVPFTNIIYIGDGMTDVPSMAVIRANGGHAIAVYPESKSSQISENIKICQKLLKAGRVDFIAPANYLPNQILENRVKILLNTIIRQIEYQTEVKECYKQHQLN